MNKEINNEVVAGNNEVVVFSKDDMATTDMMSMLEAPESNFFCSIEDDGTRKSKVRIYNAVNSAEEQLIDHVNTVIEVVDVVAHEVKLPDMQTGEMVSCLRTVLIDKNGVGYQAVSTGLVSALQKVFAIIGSPSWVDEPVKMKVVSKKSKKGFNFTSIELVD